MERPKYITELVIDENANLMRLEPMYKEVTRELTDEDWEKIQKENN